MNIYLKHTISFLYFLLFFTIFFPSIRRMLNKNNKTNYDYEIVTNFVFGKCYDKMVLKTIVGTSEEMLKLKASDKYMKCYCWLKERKEFKK